MTIAKKADFIIENKQPVYPNITTDGLVLYYDAKGKENSHTNRENLVDMSGNGNHGELYNFAYEKFSGYKDGLIFDGIDDKLVRPELDLTPDDFTFMLNGNIISFSRDGTVKRVQDGEVITSKGFNVIRNGNFSDGLDGWMNNNSTTSLSTENNEVLVELKEDEINSAIVNNKTGVPLNHKLYLHLEAHTPHESSLRTYVNSSYSILSTIPKKNEWTIISGIISNGSENQNYFRIYVRGQKGSVTKLRNIKLISLTETFGAGNEPTKEQMDAIIDRFGFIPNAQDLIDRIEYKGNVLGDMENIIDDMDKDKVSGTEIYTGKADDSVVHVEVDGKSVGGGSGKNLFNIRQHTYSPTITPNEWGGFDRSGGYGGITASEIKVKPNQTYTFSYKVEYGSARQLIHDGDGSLLYALGTDTNVSFTPKHSTISIGINNVSADNNVDSRITEIQLEEGSTATEYEPPAPTPDHPIEIHSLNDFDVVSSVGKRNLMRNSDFKDGMSNWGGDNGEVVNRDGYIYYEFTGNGEANIYGTGANYKVLLEPNTEYIYSVDIWAEEEIKINRSTPLHYHIKSISTGQGVSEGVSLVSDSAVEANKWSRVILQFRTNSTTDGYLQPYIYGFPNGVLGRVKNFKLEKSSTVTPYIPSLEDVAEETNHPLIDKINFLLDEPLRSVEDIKDRLFRDSDGLWKIERNVGELIADGTNLTLYKNYSSDNSNWLYFIRMSSLPGAYDAMKTSFSFSHLSKGGRTSPGTTEQSHIGYRVFGYSTVVYINMGDLSTRGYSNSNEGIESFFADEYNKGTPFTIHYDTDNPTVEILDQDLQDKLNNLRSFQDSNYVYTLNNKTDNLSDYIVDNLKPTLYARFLPADWYKEDRVINNLMIYNRALSDGEMLQNYRSTKHRWGM